MAASRVEKMGNRKGLAGFIDRLRYHEASRQGLGLILLLVCAFSAEAAGEVIGSSLPCIKVTGCESRAACCRA